MSEEARQMFPKGLKQPETGFRFSTDSLLLSSFVKASGKCRILDLGTGCGVIPLGIALCNPDIELNITGVDISPEMLECANHNVAESGFADRIEILEGDVCNPQFASAESYDVVVSNPPYWCEGRGRPCPDADRNRARFEVEAELEDFAKTAARMVRFRGKVCFVFLAERVTQLLAVLTSFKLEPKRIKFVHSHMDRPAKVVLVEAVKNGKTGLIVEPPLILFQDKSKGSVYNQSALDFCKFIMK
ncbi:tRNA1Val (adenine37-N6)-methyltransferase [Maridesulfovibrio ferrireducens]|uniref:tRNA1Val (Adenine37-N6)-methyltransferase n=1 Tax=Maridesulfovibrio ferrireducens TaxID=246191 RepID=A0A1G9BYK2_9BACT|nr:methyltransferase [Maridesulfovibrio ferrireducens]SDK44529.1 tRNA1Val (adenine37-N6)-methyltransferase [Maridesulfovibrio ferrireducens]